MPMGKETCLIELSSKWRASGLSFSSKAFCLASNAWSLIKGRIELKSRVSENIHGSAAESSPDLQRFPQEAEPLEVKVL